MKKTLCIVLFITLLLSGYIKVTEKISYSDIYNIPKQNNQTYLDSEPNYIPINGDELKPFEGEWVTTKLSVTPRVALVKESYAKENSSIIGKKLVISDECVTFEGEDFYVSETEVCDGIQIMSYYNITPHGAYTIYCGDKPEQQYTTSDYYVKLVSLSTLDKENGINLIVRPDNTLMLWVGEMHYYIGFYELVRVNADNVKGEHIKETSDFKDNSSDIEKFIKKYEGGPYSETYEVSEGDWRIGYGHRIKHYDGDLHRKLPEGAYGDLRIGYGHKLETYYPSNESNANMRWNKTEAEWGFISDIKKMKNITLVPFLIANDIELNQSQFDAMLSFTFSYGEYAWGQYGCETMKKFLLKGDYSKKAVKKAFETYMDDSMPKKHISRRNAEMEMFLSKAYGNNKVQLEYERYIYPYKRDLDSDELKPFEGKWVVKRLSVTPRVGLVSEEYAKANSDIIGKEILVSGKGITFNSQKFYGTDVGWYDGLELMSIFNITPSGAYTVCCGNNYDEYFSVADSSVEVIGMSSADNKTHINLVTRPEDNTMMLWVGEQYKYVGFYELERVN